MIWIGAQSVVDVLGTFKNRSTVVLNASTRTKLVSEDPKVVAIHDYGELIGVAKGTTNVVIRVDDQVIPLRVTVTNPP